MKYNDDKFKDLLKLYKRESYQNKIDVRHCPDNVQLAGYFDGVLSPTDEKRIIEHLADCSICRMILSSCIDVKINISSDLIKPSAADILESELSIMEKSLGGNSVIKNNWIRPNIMVVDDDPIYLSSLVDTLSVEFNVSAFADGFAAIQETITDYRVIVLDIKMAGISGLEVADHIKSHHYSIPIILNTGYPGEYMRHDIESRYHPFEYVTKDNPEKLFKIIRKASYCSL